MGYRLAGGAVDVASRREWLRLAAASPLGLWLPHLAGRLPAAVHARLPSASGERLWARYAAAALRMNVATEGLEHVDPARPHLVAALHEGVVDPVVLLGLPLRLRFAIRDELFGWRYFGRYLAASRHIGLRPELGAGAYRRLLRHAGGALADGESVVVFPQGTLLGIETAFRGGAFHLAQHFAVPILPVVLTGTHRVWERPFSPRVRLGQSVAMRVLSPVEPLADPEDLRLALQLEMKRHALEGAMPPARRFDPDRDGFWEAYRYEIDPAFPELAARVALNRAGATPRRSTSPSPAPGA